MTHIIVLILSAYVFGSLAYLVAPLLASGVVLCVWFARKRPGLILLVVCSAFAGYVLSFLAAGSVFQKEDDVFHRGLPQEGRVVRIDERMGGARITIELENAVILAYTGEEENVKRGDMVSITGRLERAQNFVDEDGYTVPYRTYLFSRGVVGVARDASLSVLKKRSVSFETVAYTLREWVTERTRNTIPEPEASLLLGLLVGDASGLGEDVDRGMRRAGLTHILVLSGFNVSILVIALFVCASMLPLSLRALVVLLCVSLLVVASGGDPPAVRAGVMGVLGVLGLLLGREREALHLTLVTLLLMLVVEPLLILNISFQLSACATLGVITLGPHILRTLPKLPLRDVLATTLAAIVGVLPLSVVSFHQVSLVAPLSNLVVLPLVPLGMALGGAGILVGLVAPSFGALIAYPVLHMVLSVGVWFGSLPFAAVPYALTPASLLVYVVYDAWLLKSTMKQC